MRLNRREFLSASLLTMASSVLRRPLWASDPANLESIYSQAIVVDGCGAPGGFNIDPNAPLTNQRVLDAKNSGLTCLNLTVGPVGNRPASEALEGIFNDLGYWENELDHHPDTFTKIKKYEDITATKSTNKVGLIFGLQDGV